MSNGNIPTDEDFARASELMRERDFGLDEISSYILIKYKSIGLTNVFLFYSQDNHLSTIHLFFDGKEKLNQAKKANFTEEITNMVAKLLEQVGRGSKETIKVEAKLYGHTNLDVLR